MDSITEMATHKYPLAGTVQNVEISTSELVALKGSTTLDQKDMSRLGKYQSLQVQFSNFQDEGNTDLTFQRMFGHFSTLAFSMILMSSWETELAYAFKRHTCSNLQTDHV